MTTVAILDEDDILIGFRTTKSPKKSEVVVPDNCDLKTDGRYRYNRDIPRFDPIPAVLVKIGESSAFNKMVVAHLLGVLPKDQVTQAVRDSADFIKESDPEAITNLQRRYARRKKDR